MASEKIIKSRKYLFIYQRLSRQENLIKQLEYNNINDAVI